MIIRAKNVKYVTICRNGKGNKLSVDLDFLEHCQVLLQCDWELLLIDSYNITT